ncbi:MAG: hypothetical protein NC548_59405 [Lachnospiraceae bacterium]|nr:hypothetical protein [Lachnospiraceae bacterium]
MKKLTALITSAISLWASAQQNARTDSIASTLDEVVVTADSKIETSKKVILTPTKLEKKHSTNGYSLLENMNLPDFSVNASTQSISTIDGRNAIILINGVVAQPDELATLSAAEITRIDYQRNPGGRFVGSGAAINFITAQYEHGGNIYISANEGLARQCVNYVGMANYKKKAVTITLTANGKWENFSQLTKAENTFALNDGALFQSIDPLENNTRTNSQYLNFKFAHAANNHSFDVSLALTRSATPKNLIDDNVRYSGLYNFNSTATRRSKENGLSPVIKMHYNLFHPGGHTFMLMSTLRHGHTDFKSVYSETNTADIQNNTLENNVLASLTLGYFKSFPSGLSLGATVDEYYNYYHDAYSGSFSGNQTLQNNHTMAALHIDHTLAFGLSYYASLGLTDLYSSISGYYDNQFSPMAYYGVTYSPNRKHSISANGRYTHSIYNPSYKNDAIIRTSFFEATMGNPGLEQLKAFQNFISYNGHFGMLGISFSYYFLKYFGNTSNRYFAEDNIMWHQLVNDGDFQYNKLTFGLSANLIENRLRLRGNATYSMNRFESEYRPAKSNDWRADFNASYIFDDWQARATYAIPYSVLGIEGTKSRCPAQYGLTIGWQHGNWSAECSAENFMKRRMGTRVDANYGAYRSLAKTLSDLKGRNISITITYTLPYGRKTDRGKVETESKINSAILRPF